MTLVRNPNRKEGGETERAVDVKIRKRANLGESNQGRTPTLSLR